MRAFDTICRVLDRLLSALTTLVAVALLIFSCYALYDDFYASQSAFVSRDLLQYRPQANEDGSFSFDELMAINKDVVGWLAVDDTHIDYPVVQGRDNSEYSSKSVHGKPKISGSIYLAAENDPTFADGYSIIYGHHMDNGAMFGDIDLFLDKRFLKSHPSGVLQTPSGGYQLTFFACMRTSLGDSRVYGLSELRNRPDLVVSYLREAADVFVPSYAYGAADTASESPVKIVALSTCTDSLTNGRVLLFARAVPGVAVDTASSVPRRVAVGRVADGSWALLNLVLLLVTTYALLPLGWLRAKYRQLGFARRAASDLREGNGQMLAALAAEGRAAHAPRLADDLTKFFRMMVVGVVAEVVLALAALVIFVRTEDMIQPMTLFDGYTGLMFALAAAALVTDFLLFGYHGEPLPGKRD